MHFLKVGRDLVDPVAMGDALTRVIHKRPSADAHVFLDEATGETMVTIPWGSVEEAQTRLIEFVHGSTVIHKRLQEDVLSAYVENPINGTWLRIPREYWFQHAPGGDYRLLPVEGATGWGEAMQGQPVIVDAADLSRWEEVAAAALASLKATLSPPATELEAPPEKRGRQTRSKPKWYPALRTMFEEEEKRHAEWPNKHSGHPPRFRSAADYRLLLIEKKFPASMLPPATVRYHVAALKQEFGR